MAEPKQWSPKMDENQIRGVIDQYNMAPQLFDNRDDDIESLEEHANYYKIPFARQPQHQDALIIRMLKEAGKGFAEGFTTLPLLGEAAPKSTWEGIASNLGHLAGFVGYLPGARALRNIKGLRTYSQVGEAIRGTSIPMGGANLIQKQAKRVIEPILNDLPEFAKSPIFSDMASGAFHLGTASAISSWTHGVDEMMKAAGFGGIAGGAFRFIGNMKGLGTRIEPSQMKPNGSPDFKMLTDGQKFDLFMRTTAGAMFQGLPASLQGATTEEQVYNYAMGAFFGFKEVPYQTRTSREFLADSMKKDTGPDPELNPRWDTLTTEMKGIVKKDFQHTFQYSENGPSESSHVIYDILKGRGFDIDAIEKMGKGFEEGYRQDSMGQIRKDLSKKEQEDYQKRYKEDKTSQEQQDMDMHFADVKDVPGTLIGKGGYVDNLFKDLGSYERIGISTEINKVWEGLHKNGKPIEGAEQEIIKFIEGSSWGRALNEKEKGFWRRWAEQTRKKEFVEQINIVDQEISIQEGIVNPLGNRKELKNEPLVIEEIFDNEAFRVYREPLEQRRDNKFIRVLDEVIYNGKAYDLGRVVESITRVQAKQLKEDRPSEPYYKLQAEARNYAESYYKNRMSELAQKMYEEGYYYFGGKGDAKRMYFVKLHPNVAKTTNGVDLKAKKGMSKRYLKKINKVIDDFLKKADPDKYPNKRKAEFVYMESFKKFKEAYPKLKNPEEVFRRMYVSNVLYDIQNNGFSAKMAEFEANFKKVLGDGYINDPRGFNKRQQIWFNTGYSADPLNVQRLAKKAGIELAKDPENNDEPAFRVILFKDAKNRDIADENGAIPIFAKANKYTEATDGAIVGRNGIVDALNLDKGLPVDGKMNKSFIVEPYKNNNEFGAMLGKYAIHIGSPEMEAFMKKNNYHMVLPESAVKATGGRKVGDLTLGKGGAIQYNGEAFLLPVKAFRTVLTEITSDKFIKRQRVPKQMFSVLSEYGYSDIDPKVMKDMQDTLSLRATEGTPEGKQILETYYNSKTPENMQRVVENLENLPIKKVFEILKDDSNPKLAQKLYEKILRVDVEQMKHLAEEGEMNREQYEQAMKNSVDYESIVERVNSVYPDGSVAAYLHKFSRDYRMQAMRNYVVHKFTRPEIDNSASSRMRPYEIGLQKKNKSRDDTSILNTDEGQTVFFLDNGHKNLRIYDEVFGKRGMITLGELWANRQEYIGKDATPEVKKKVENILEAIVMRVPMDSISGAHKLRFAGFTGIDGFGSLLHPRTMRALGGADLDGDKATIFFGGESRGFKQAWKEMYHKNKDEYVNAKGTHEKHNKNEIDPLTGDTYASAIAERNEKFITEMEHLGNQYSPYWRQYISQQTFSGRDNLGVAVVERASVLGAYNMVRKGTFGPDARDGIEKKVSLPYWKDGKEVFYEGTVNIGEGTYSRPYMHSYYNSSKKKRETRPVRLIYRAKLKPEDLQRFRELSRAMIAIGSDPMDEAKVNGTLIPKKIFDTLFDVKIMEVDKYGRPTREAKDPGSKVTLTEKYYNDKSKDEFLRRWADQIRRGGPQTMFNAVNRVLYSRNYAENRRYSYSEIQQGVREMDWIPDNMRTTFLPHIAKQIQGIDWSDGLFTRMDFGNLMKVYDANREYVADLEPLREVMGRKTLQTPMSKLIQHINDNKIWNPEVRKKLARNTPLKLDNNKKPIPSPFEVFVNHSYLRADGTTALTVGMSVPKKDQMRNPKYKENYLENLVLKAEDYIINDLSDMASLKVIADVVKKYDIPDNRFEYIHENADRIKSKAKGFYTERRRLDRELAKTLEDWMVQTYANKDIPFPLTEFIEGTLKQPARREKTSAVNDAIKTDKLIRDFKGSLKDKGEKALFDMLYMGTYPKGNQKRLDALLKLPKEVQKKPDIADAIKYLQGAKLRTALLREGLRSKEIDAENLKTFFTEYDNLIRKSSKGLDKEAEAKLIKEAETNDPLKSIFDSKGNLVENEFVNANRLDAPEIKYLDEIAPFKGISEGKYKDREMRRLKNSLDDHLNHYHNLDVVNLNGFFRGIFGKDLNQANKLDLQKLDRIFKDMRDGSTWQQITDWFTGRKPKDPIPIKKSNYWKFPEAIERDLRRSPATMDWIADVGPYTNKLGNTIENARIVRPTATMGELQQVSAKATEMSMNEYERLSGEWQDELRPFYGALPEGDILYRAAVAKREYDYARIVIIPNNPKDGNEMAQPYFQNWSKYRNEHAQLSKKNYNVPTEQGVQKMTGEQVMDKINRIITKYNEKNHRFLKGNPDKIKEFLSMSEVGGNVTWSGLDTLRKNFYKYLTKTMRENIRLPIEEIGLDGLKQIIKRIQLSNIPVSMRRGKEGKRLLEEVRRKAELEETGTIEYQFYYPHMSFDRKSATKNLLRALKKVAKDKELTEKEIEQKAKNIIAQHKQMTGDFILKDDMDQNWKVVKQALEKIAEGREKRAQTILRDGVVKVGNQFKREAHIGGWELTPEAYEAYMKNIISQFYKSITQVSARTVMHNFRESSLAKGNSAQFTNDWMTFFEMYTQAAMGYPVQIPNKVLNNPRMKLDGTPYKWLADSRAKDRIDSIRKKLNIGREELEKLDLSKKVVDELSGIEYTQLQNWGAMEAKYQLASLLAHPKSAIANYYGGTVHTWISAGYDNLKKARNFEYLKTNINPKWKSMKDVEKWLQELGVLEEFLIYEAGLNPQLKSRKTQEFVKKVADKYKKNPNDPDLKDKGLYRIAKESGLTEKAFQAASSFMRIPERALRRDAFIAHYLQARAKFGGAIADYNSPFLIKMAKRGVKATQFLYSAPYRPMWANSTLGRVFSRFQIWSWNSVRFRNDVLRQARLAGYKPGTQEFESFKRLAAADLMMLSLSNLFMYSLFENSLPAPWNWFQDTTDYLFGDDKTRERAFFGSPIGPVQAITPPALRLLPPLFKGLVSNDWERMTDYYLWTMLPFGRLVRDVVGPGGVLENPYYSVTKFTGIPLMQIGNLITQDEDEKGKQIRGRIIH